MPNAVSKGEVRARWERRLLIGVFVLLNVVAIGRLAWFWYLSDPARQLIVGPETTFVEGPLKDNGLVDYVAAINQRQSEGVTPDNNSVVLLVRAYGPQVIGQSIQSRYFDALGVPPPSTGQYLVGEQAFITQARSGSPSAPVDPDVPQKFSEQRGEAATRPWTRDEFPNVAAMLDKNAAPLALIVEASQRERYYSPLLTSDPNEAMFSILLPVEQEQREAARQLTARSMLKLGEGDVAGAWSDLLACHRLGRLTGQCPYLIGALVSIAIDAVACESDRVLLNSPLLTAEQARQCLADLQRLPPLPSIADLMGRAERMSLLDATLQFARDPSQLSGLGETTISVPAIRGAIDWNVTLKLVNKEVDKAVAAMREQTVATRTTEFGELDAGLHRHTGQSSLGLGLRSFLGDRAGASTDMGWSILSNLMPASMQAMTAETRARARVQVLQTGFALVAWQRGHGAYPETLAALVPEILPVVPIDPWSNKELIYRRTETGFRVYSVWDDMRDDGGVDFALKSGGPGDFAIEVGRP